MNFAKKILHKFGLYSKETVKRAYNIGRREKFVFDAGITNNLTYGWLTTATSIDKDIRDNLVAVRERARNFAKNNALIKRWLALCRANIVGPDGIILQMNVRKYIQPKTKNEVGQYEDDNYANELIETAWEDWCKPQNCSVDGRYSFRELCDLIVTGKKRDGEAFIRLVRNKSKYGLQLQVIPPEAIDERYNVKLANGNTVIMGVEVDSWHRPVAYYVKRYDPERAIYGIQQFSGNYDRIPATDIIHYFTAEYPEQTRGISEMSAIMLLLWHLSGWVEASVVNARAAAAKGLYFKTDKDHPESYKGDLEDEEGNIIRMVQPGEAEQLPPGVEPFLVDPKYPHEQHGPFYTSLTTEISAGLNVAYSSLTNDLSKANYGSQRQGLINERDGWKTEHNQFDIAVLNKIFAEWLTMADLRGAIKLPISENFDYYNQPTWSHRTFDWIDPVKDVEAIRTQLQLRMTSLFDVVGSRGKKLEQLFKDIQEVERMAQKYGITLNLYDKPSETKTTEDSEENQLDEKNMLLNLGIAQNGH